MEYNGNGTEMLLSDCQTSYEGFCFSLFIIGNLFMNSPLGGQCYKRQQLFMLPRLVKAVNNVIIGNLIHKLVVIGQLNRPMRDSNDVV